MSKFKFGLQLYSVRDFMEKDVQATLKAVSEMGYECVEFAGYYGKSAKEIKALCEKYNLIPISAHQVLAAFTDNPEENLKFIKDLGVKFCGISASHPSDWKEDYKKFVDDINKAGACFKENGIQLLYHNHDFEFYIKHGEYCALDAIYKDVSPECLCPELDLCWLEYAGRSSVEYIKKYGDIEQVV